MTNPLHVARNGQILEITLDRPKANAIDAATSREMGARFSEFRDDPALRVAIITGSGEKFFSAGWDLHAAAEGEPINADYGVGGFAGLTELHDLNKPVIAAVNGLAVGGGFELALACDLIVAVENAEFFLPEALRGVVADAGSFRLPKYLPHPIAMEMLLTGRRLSATEAKGWGLVNAIAPRERLLDTARDLAAAILRAAPLSVAAVKEIVRATEGLDIPACYELLRSGKLAAYERMLISDDAKEGAQAFVEKREPVWKAR